MAPRTSTSPHRARERPRTSEHDLQEELRAWKEGAQNYRYDLATRGMRTLRKVATYDVGNVAKAAYHSSAGKEVRELGKSIANAAVGIPTRILRSAVNGVHYLVKGATSGALEVLPKKLHDTVESLLERKIDSAEHGHSNYITLSRQDLEALHYVEPRLAIQHLAQKIDDAERRQGEVRIPVAEAYSALQDLKHHGRTGRFHRYRAVGAVLAFAVALLSFDQVRVTGMAVSEATGGYDYYSFFGFLFLALALILLMMSHRKRR